MNILILTGHPAQVHNFRHLKIDLENKGHSVFWMATEKDISKYLLKQYKIKYSALPKPGKSFYSKIFHLIKNTVACFKFLKANKIDIIISRVSPYAALAGFIMQKPHIALADTETSGVYDTVFTKFVSCFVTAKSFQRNLRKDQIWFDGNIELFYLHPNRFQPREDVSRLLGIEKGQPYVVMRFVSWDAYHDKGLKGFTDAKKIKAVKAFSKYTRVFISAEKDLPPDLEPYKIQIPPEKMHDVLAHASLFFGESATMASESAVLGTPAVYLDQIGRGYTDEEEAYGLVSNYKNALSDQEQAIQKGLNLLKNPNLKEEMHKNRQRFLENKIDVTAFMAWFVESFPESKRKMLDDPDYQGRFR